MTWLRSLSGIAQAGLIAAIWIAGSLVYIGTCLAIGCS